MTTYFLHDGRNEAGPFTIDQLKKQQLNRNTPIREDGKNNWAPAEKIAGLKEIVAPRKIRRPKDIVPVMMERVADFKQRRPKTLYGSFLFLALVAGVSIYSIGKTNAAVVQEPAREKTNHASFSGNNPVTGMAVKKDEEKKPEIKEDQAKNSRLRWNKLITATNSNYGIGLFGGIKDLSVIVTNRSDYPIDQAVAKITYIKASGGIWKTKLVTIYGVPAHDSKTQSVPDVGRGKKVKVSIYKLVSKKMKFSYTEGQKIKNPEDPYLIQ